jgi:hypothetical protein
MDEVLEMEDEHWNAKAFNAVDVFKDDLSQALQGFVMLIMKFNKWHKNMLHTFLVYRLDVFIYTSVSHEQAAALNLFLAAADHFFHVMEVPLHVWWLERRNALYSLHRLAAIVQRHCYRCKDAMSFFDNANKLDNILPPSRTNSKNIDVVDDLWDCLDKGEKIMEKYVALNNDTFSHHVLQRVRARVGMPSRQLQRPALQLKVQSESSQRANHHAA